VTGLLWIIEPLLIIGVAFSISTMKILSQPEIGTYVAQAGAPIYSLGRGGEVYGSYRAWRRRRLTAAAPGGGGSRSR
jgi:hypothetical protein